MSLENKLTHLPDQPGVYLFKDSEGKIIYIGKARILRNRIRSYFQDTGDSSPKTRLLRTKINDLEFIVTDNEMEALILESQLVKKNQPRYNLDLKDDKSFPYIKLTVQEAFPRVFLTRQQRKDGAMYYGPYTSAGSAKMTLRLIHRYFLLRTCHKPLNDRQLRPCLDYHIRLCMAPCDASLCRPEPYRQAVENVRLLLEGKTEVLTARLRTDMNAAAVQEHFEEAVALREQIRMVESLAEHQKMILSSTEDADFFGFHQEENRVALQLFTMRGSKIIGRREFYWEDMEAFQASEFLSSALRQYYLHGGFIPTEIFIPVPMEDQLLLGKILTGRRGSRVRILVPKIGNRRRLLRLVEKNAQLAFQQRFRVLEPSAQEILQEIKQLLGLPEVPDRIECFDISNLQGTDSVASMVVCEEGRMKSSEYRRYRIKTVAGANDFASMGEVVYRRYRRLQAEKKPLPGLILVDGGKGQLASAREALSRLGLENQSLAALAKEEEAIFLPNKNAPILLKPTSHTLHLLQQIRDEAHRFALEFHQKRRLHRNLHTILEEIPGIGPKTAQKLLTRFRSLKRLKEAPYEEIKKELGPKLAQHLANYLMNNGKMNP